MGTFTELRVLCAESIFLSYGSYFLPLLLFIITKHVWKRFACDVNKVRVQREVNDTSNNAQPSNEPITENDAYKPMLPEKDHVKYRGLTQWLDKTGDTFYNLVNDRRSIRKFAKDKHVDIAVIEKCVLAAGMYTCFWLRLNLNQR